MLIKINFIVEKFVTYESAREAEKIGENQSMMDLNSTMK